MVDLPLVAPFEAHVPRDLSRSAPLVNQNL